MTDRKQELLNYAYLAYTYGFVPIGMNGKRPVGRKWQNLRNKPDDAKAIASGRYPTRVRMISHMIDKGSKINNIGIITGEASGVVVFDIDTKNNGLEQWKNLVESNGGVPRTFVVSTGEGGYHYYFKYEPILSKIPNMNGILGMPIDYRTNDGVIVFPGSVSESGNVYTIIDGYDNNIPQIASMPPWLFGLLITNMLNQQGISNPTPEQFNMMKQLLGIP